VVGFARRFATYKRAPLLRQDMDTLRENVCQDDRPVVFVFAGKAHPADGPGQDLLRQIHLLSTKPEFIGRVLLVEGYDLALARRLVAGVDVWLNNPIYPKEASGTSGMKAAMNGSINLSVLDGWWAEGYDGQNGWGIKPSPYAEDDARRDRDDARTLYEVLQDDVLPLYYDRSPHGYSPGWVRKCKRSMKTVLPRFNTCRMLNEYGRNLYLPAAGSGRRLAADGYAGARDLARWKARVRAAWPGVRFTGGGRPGLRTGHGEPVEVEAELALNGLGPEDVAVELLLSRAGGGDLALKISGALDGEGYMDRPEEEPEADTTLAERLAPAGPGATEGSHRFRLELRPEWCGRLVYRIRAFPHHPLLTHPHELGFMVWL
jgi:starch phosphorylase